MIQITFPDGSVKSFEAGVTAYDIAMSISPRLAGDVLAATVIPASDATGKGFIDALTRAIYKDASIGRVRWE